MADTINFTKATLEALPVPAAGRQEYKDSRQAGLRLRVTASGIKTFCILKRIRDSKMERITIGRYPDTSVEQARKKTSEILGKISTGNNPAESRRAIKVELTFGELFTEYANRHGEKVKSWRNNQQRYRDYLQEPLGKMKVSEITSPMISRILSDVESSGKSAAMANNVRALVSVIFSKGNEWGIVSGNPASNTKTRPKISRDRFLQNHELPRFHTALAEEPNQTIQIYFQISLLTGARRSNVQEMRWSEINFTDGIWRIPLTKNGTPQNVILAPEAVILLTQLKETADPQAVFVFPGVGESGHLVEPKKGWKRIFDRDELTQLKERIAAAGKTFDPLIDRRTKEPIAESTDAALTRARIRAKQLKLNVEGARMLDLRIHDLRRTLGSYQAILGASLLIIGKSLNHKSQQSTAIYARLDQNPVRASVERATAAMWAAGGLNGVIAPTNPIQQP